MPILRKNGQKVYFAHVPKCAGSSLYNLFMSNGWQMSNFGRPEGPLGTTGTAKMIRDEFGITDLQKEGDYSKVVTSVQHVTADIWDGWGPFDSSFALVRHPMARFKSAYSYRYVTTIGNSNVKHTPATLAEFNSIMMPFFQNELAKAPHAFDNHFRPMKDFLLPSTKIYALEHGGMEDLCKDLGLQGAVPHEKKSDFYVELEAEHTQFAQQYFAEDIEWYENLFPTQ